MAKNEWLYCTSDWSDIVNIIKLEKNCDERLREFHDILEREDLTIENVVDEWYVVEKSDIKDCVNEWVYGDDLEDLATLGNLTYWFFNIYTGEALRIKCSVSISFSDTIAN